VVVVEEVPTPELGSGKVLVRVESAAVNYPDVLIIADRYQLTVPVPFTPGSEFAGVVEEVAGDVTTFAPGDRVLGSATHGAFSELVLARASSLTRLPDDVSFDDGAAFGVVYGTAYSALRSIAEVQPGDWVVSLGAAGGVGLAVLDLARELGGRVIAAASSATKLEVCRQRGAEALIDYQREDLKARIKEITSGGADVVIDPVGGPYSESALRATRWGGRFVTVGFAAGDIPRIPLNLVLLKGVIVRGFELGSFASHSPTDAARDRAELDELFAAGRIRPHVSGVYPLEQASSALEELADRRAIGKVLVHPQR
jgi:NADPH:quinone reductase